MKRNTIFTVLALAFILTIGGRLQASTSKAVDDIREAVFRHQLQTYRNYQHEVKVYFLDIGGKQRKDPSSKFMKQFASHVPPVRQVSKSEYHAETMRVLEKKTGNRGIILRVMTVKLVKKTEAHVTGGYFVNGRAGSHNNYLVVHKNGKWVVMKDTCTAIF